MLYIRDLCKVFAPGTPNAHTALDHLNLTLMPGEFVTVLGSNGAGKSTLFSAIGGGFWEKISPICRNISGRQKSAVCFRIP